MESERKTSEELHNHDYGPVRWFLSTVIFKKLKQLIGALQVPLLVVGTQPVKGFNESSWNSALDSAGYPRTKLPGQQGPRPPESTVDTSAAPK